MVSAKIVVLPGDGIGPEVTAPAVAILKAVAAAGGHDFSFESKDFGGISIDNHGTALTDDTLESCRASDAVLLGAVGGPKWAGGSVRPEQGLLKIRKELGLFSNVRPCQIISQEVSRRISPLRPERLEGCDFIVVRELTGGIYFGERQEAEGGVAHDRMTYSEPEVERIVRSAARVAMKRGKVLTSVDKANVLACSRLWRKVAERVVAEEFPELTLKHLLVDAAAMHILRAPAEFDVIVTGNLFGDILSDEASMIPGSLGLLPSASLTESGWGLYEPIHGSAPDIAGQGIANPVGTILSAAMLLRLSLGLGDEADAVEAAVRDTLAAGICTGDVAEKGAKVYKTDEVGAAVLDNLKAKLAKLAPPATM